MLEGERSRQKEENTGGQTPRGYPGQALSVGPAESSGLCLVIDISNQIELSKSDEACLFKNAHIRALRRFGISRVRFCVLVGVPVSPLKSAFDCFLGLANSVEAGGDSPCQRFQSPNCQEPVPNCSFFRGPVV